MPKKLEDFIQVHREAFDDKKPSEKLWKNIENKLPKKQQDKTLLIRMTHWKWAMAASVIAIAALAIYFLQASKGSNLGKEAELFVNAETTQKRNDTKQQNIDTAEAVDTALDEKVESQVVADDLQNFGQKQIERTNDDDVSALQARLLQETKAEPYLQQQFKGDLKVLEESYKMLQKQLAQTPNQDVIIKAMVQNLALQAELLKRQLTIVDQYKLNKKPIKTKNNGSTI